MTQQCSTDAHRFVSRVLSHTSGSLLQTVEEIAEIVRQAQNPPAGPAGWDQDEYIGACPQPCALALQAGEPPFPRHVG